MSGFVRRVDVLGASVRVAVQLDQVHHVLSNAESTPLDLVGLSHAQVEHRVEALLQSLQHARKTSSAFTSLVYMYVRKAMGVCQSSMWMPVY
jgi:hypothetical protein